MGHFVSPSKKMARANVDMLNLVYRDTVDKKIYERLSLRMKDRLDIIGSLPPQY